MSQFRVVGHNRQECSFNPSMTPGNECGSPATFHVIVVNNEEAITRMGDDFIVDFAHPDVHPVFACDEHLEYIVRKFSGRMCLHTVAGHPCQHPDAVWADDGCIFPPDTGLTLEVAEEVSSDA
ncbi:MAG TPA: hypothetical protein VIG24_15600 [Acidimicrobiia bacterium]